MSPHAFFPRPASRLALALVCAFSVAGVAHAADRSTAAEAQAQYKRDLASCNSDRATEDRATCRTEAARAYALAKSGEFNGGADYARNARARCEALKGGDRQACEARMSGAGSVEGSVGGGGILRESTRTVPAR